MSRCYRLYKQDLTNTKKRLILVENQCAGYRTNKTSKTIKQGVAKSYNKVQYVYTREHKNLYTNISTFLYTQTFTIGRR